MQRSYTAPTTRCSCQDRNGVPCQMQMSARSHLRLRSRNCSSVSVGCYSHRSALNARGSFPEQSSLLTKAYGLIPTEVLGGNRLSAGKLKARCRYFSITLLPRETGKRIASRMTASRYGSFWVSGHVIGNVHTHDHELLGRAIPRLLGCSLSIQ